jgi:hydrogenase maturation protease
VTIVEGGTWGLTLLPIIEESDRVLLLDAIRAGTEPGTVVRVSGADLTRVYGARVSPHQVDLTDVLALAAWRGTLPDAVVAIGAEPAMIDLAATLSPVVHAAIERAADAAAVQLGEWGHVCERRGPAREDTTGVTNCPERMTQAAPMSRIVPIARGTEHLRARDVAERPGVTIDENRGRPVPGEFR